MAFIERTRKLTSKQKWQAVSDYLGGASCSVLGGRFGVRSEAIRKILKHRGVVLRSAAETMRMKPPNPHAPPGKRRHALDHTAFDKPGPAGRYWIGMLITDGCVSGAGGRSQSIRLGLAVRDREHVAAFRDYVKSTAPVTTRPAQRSEYKGQQINSGESASVCINSTYMASALQSYGVVPRKSLTAKAAPALEDDRDFWRGVIDGDGSLTWSQCHGQPAPALLLYGSQLLVQQFAAYVQRIVPGSKATPREKRPTTWCYKVSSEIARRVIGHLYQPGDTALPRKAELAEAMIGWAARSHNTLDPRPGCAICGSKVLAKGLCCKHYKRQYKHGSPLILHDKQGNRING